MLQESLVDTSKSAGGVTLLTVRYPSFASFMEGGILLQNWDEHKVMVPRRKHIMFLASPPLFGRKRN